MQTAVQQLIELLAHNNILDHKALSSNERLYNLYKRLKEQAETKEKQQIIDAHGDEQSHLQDDGSWRTVYAEQYYNETYVSKGSDDQVPDVRKMVEDDNYLTPVDWLMDRIKWINRETYDYLIKEGQYDRAKRMESSTSSQTEISDEEIEKFTNEFAEKYSKVGVTEYEVSAFFTGMKWYREQLKSRQ